MRGHRTIRNHGTVVAMREVLVYESKRRLRGAIYLSVGLSVYALLIVAFYPSVAESGVDFDAYIESFPPAVRAAFNIQALGTVEGFLAAEFYQFAWVLLLGLYAAYAAGSSVASAIEDGRIELVLAAPISRTRYLLGTYGAVLFPLLLLNVLAIPAVLLGLVLIGESVSVADLIATHALAVPYLFATAAIGLVLSVIVSRGSIAERAGLGVIFLLFIGRSVTAPTDLEWLGYLSPTAYYDPTDVLVGGEYGLVGAVVLLAMALALLVVARTILVRRDV
jgi:ABC-2 type transport system permease protein